MPANEFEKQVQKQLDELKLEPSASVWEKVEKELREKKRRRIIFFFILPALLGLLGFSFYRLFYVNEKATPAQQQASTGKAPSPVPAHPFPQVKETTVPAKDEKHKDDNVVTKDMAGKQETSAGRPAALKMAVSGSLVQRQPGKEATKNSSHAMRLQRKKESAMEVTVDAPAKQEAVATADKTGDADTGKPVSAGAEKITTEDAAVVKIQGEESRISGDEPSAVKKDSSKKKDVEIVQDNHKKEEAVVQKKKRLSKLKWGVDMSAGLSFNAKNTLSFARAEALDQFLNNGAPATGYGTAPVTVVPPSPVNEGLSFRAGLTAEWQASERSRLSAGLQYAYSSNRTTVGKMVDTSVTLNTSVSERVSVDKVYTGSRTENYTNNFHFVRLPLTYHWKISKNRKLPVEWNVGTGISYLVTTNALLYSGSLGGSYYQDKDAFNKLHVDLNTGFSFRFTTKNKVEWVIGPVLSFDMTPLVKYNTRQYMMFGGLNARLLFPKKKNN